jgi:hypothetical protein
VRDWNEAGFWQGLHEVSLAELKAARKLDRPHCAVDLVPQGRPPLAPSNPLDGFRETSTG